MLNLSSRPDPEAPPLAVMPRWAAAVRSPAVKSPVEGGLEVRLPTIARQPGQTRSLASVLGSVRDGLRQGDRLIVVTGESGTGKSMLCRALIEEAELLTFTSVMLQPPATPEDLLAQFLRDVGVLDPARPAGLMTRNTLVFALQRFMESLIPLGARAVLVIDEAQHLPPAVLEQLRLALNFETGQGALLQVVLVGLPELDTLLRWPELRRVAQRVSRRCELGGIEADEWSDYLDECVHRRSAGGIVRLTPASEKLVARVAGGVPRVADMVCAHAIDIAAGENARRIEPRMVRRAAKRIGLAAAPTMDRRRLGLIASAVMTCAVVAGGAWGWMHRGGAADTPHATQAASAATPPPGAPGVVAAALPQQPLEMAGGLTVTVATFRTESRARAVVAQLAADGFPAFIRSRADGTSHQVIVGPYVSAEEAAAAQKSMASQGVSGTEVRIETTNLSEPAWR